MAGTLIVSCGNDNTKVINFKPIPDTEIPDKEGMTLKGVVFCNGKGVPDVVVSDGLDAFCALSMVNILSS